MDSTREVIEGVDGPLLGRTLTADEAARLAATPVHSLPLSRSLLVAFAGAGYKSVADLLNAMSVGSFGPIRARRIRRAIQDVLLGEFTLEGLAVASASELPRRIDALLGRLDERRQNILRRKFGLWDGRRLDHLQIAKALSTDYRAATLEIGGAQAEVRNLLRVGTEEFRGVIRSVYRTLLAAKQGMAGVHDWEDPASAFYDGQAEACLGFAFLCRIGNVAPERLVAVGLHGVCFDGPLTNRRHDEVVDAIKTALINMDRPVSLDELVRWLKRIETSQEFILRCVAVSREFGRMKSGMIGLRSGAYFDAHTLRDMARAALAALEAPAHYETIAREIERLYPERAPVNSTSVYHVLVVHKDDFALAKHGGVYGLADWPQRAAESLKDVLIGFMRQNGGRATRQELLSAARERGYKAASVSTILNSNRTVFRRAAWGLWELTA